MNIENYLLDKELEQQHQMKLAQLEFETVKVSLNIDSNLDRRLRYVSNEVGVNRSVFMRDLFYLALDEFEKHLSLDPTDFDKPYANYVYAGIEEFKIGPITFSKEQFIQLMKDMREKEKAELHSESGEIHD